MRGEGRGLSSRPTQDVVRDREIGQPSNSEKCSETADGVTRESEGGSRLSLLRPVRQAQPRRHSGACLCPVPLEQGRAGYRLEPPAKRIGCSTTTRLCGCAGGCASSTRSGDARAELIHSRTFTSTSGSYA